MFDLLGLDGEVAHSGCDLLEESVHIGRAIRCSIKDDSYPWFLHWMTLYQKSQLNASKAAANSSTYMDLDVHQHPPAEKSSAMSHAFLCKSQTCPETCKAEQLTNNPLFTAV
jgi:hypothetical protein